MKVLFLIGATSRIRNFHDALMAMADAGHEITLAGRLRKGAFELPKTVTHPQITGRVNPTQREDGWADVVDLLRGARDYVRYFDPRYGQATRLVRRAYEIAPTEFVLFCERHPWIRRNWDTVARLLAVVEDLIPVDPGFERFVREERPDLIVVTPLVTFESYQTDYVKVANALGIPVAFIPFSWDNLTNKGLIRVQPDRVLVWNEVQRREALDLHACRPDQVVMTGAARFDDFFTRTPSSTREAFCAEYGLDPARPILLYLGSSQLTGPNEMELVRRWAEAVRASADPVLRGANILLRPHPAVRNSYVSADYSDLGHMGVQLNASRNADQELYDSIWHAHAAIGLNTSAMIEAAIVGRPVHTLVIPGFDEGQIGTMHFHYLVEAYGGLATVARSFDEHLAQLAAVTAQPAQVSERSRHFAAEFLRPHGVDRPASPYLAEAILDTRTVTKRPAPASPWWHGPVRSALLGWLHRRRTATAAVADHTVVGTSMSLRPVRTALEEIQQGTAPVFVGPWGDSLGNEVLYWIPFVRWIAATYGLPPERLIVLSGAPSLPWYAGLGVRSLDIFSLFSPAELEHWRHRTVPQSDQDPKQAVIPPFDAEVIERAVRAFELSDHQVLHPSMLFRVLRRLQKEPEGQAQLNEVLRYQPAPPSQEPVPGLPASYVAMSARFTDAMPASPEHAALLATVAAEAAAGRDVVIIDAPSEGVTLPASPRIHHLASLAPAAPLARVLARADAFLGAHGDLALLSAFSGTPALTWFSEKLPADLEGRLALTAEAGWAPVTSSRAARFKSLKLPRKARS